MGAGFCAHFIYFKEDSIIYNDRPNAKPRKENEDLVNENIRFPQVLVIGPDGKSLGVMPPYKGRQLADTYQLDLVCLNPTAKTPVCKILNYGKYRFEAQKKAKEMKRNQRAKEIGIHEIQLTPVIGQHDLDTKIKQANKFLQDGDKVKVTLRFRGRQLSHIEVGEEVINRFVEGCKELANVEKDAKLDGKILTCILASKIKK